MKIYIFLLGALLSGVVAFGQQISTITSPAGTASGRDNNQFWSRAGNNNSNGNNNVFGTLWNSPIYTQTNTVNRTKLNGTLGIALAPQYTISGLGTGQGVNTSGYFLIGVNNQPVGSSTNFFNTKGAFSMLHLNGTPIGINVPEFGYRAWMKTGITLTDNLDLSYIGLRRIDNNDDFTETTIAVADNYGPNGGTVGPDDIVFRFTTDGGTAATTYSTDTRNPYDIDGVHLARFTSYGLMGLGNTFGMNGNLTPASLYVRPQSLLHLSFDRQASTLSNPYPNAQLNEAFGFMQITYRRPLGVLNDIVGEGELETDGLRLGIDNDMFGSTLPTRHLNGYLRWQEASSFIIQTEDNNVPNIQANERMRITSLGALRLNYTTAQYNGFSDSSNVTRVGISHSGRFALTKPKSLLHIGYDYGNPPILGVQGYRTWMDLGMLVSNSRDHVWLGLLPRDTVVSTVTQNYERNDAVMAWGTDRNVNAPTQVDRMRFVFTGSVLDVVPEISPSNSVHGLEMMRMYPATVYKHPTYITPGDSISAYGRVGVGDFTWSGVNEEPTQKLDVVGNGRFRYLPDSTFMADSLVTKIVMVDSNGVLRWKSFVPSEFGTYCADDVNGKLDDDKKVVLNNHNLYFTNHPDSVHIQYNRMGLGYPCGDNLPGKLSVWQLHDTTINQNTIAGHFMVSDTANNPAILTNFYGAWGEANGLQPTNLKTINNGGYFYARSAQVNFGVRGRAEQGGLGSPTQIGVQNIGGQFEGVFGSQTATGVVGGGSQATLRNYGVSGFASSPTTPSQVENIGGQFSGGFSANDNMGVKAVGYGGNHAYGIFATASGGAINHAAYFNGNVEVINGTYISDQQFKDSVKTITGGLKTLALLNPVSYQFDVAGYPQFNFGTEQQFGFIAQEVQTVLPNLVYQSQFPAQYDSLGNEIAPAVDYKSLNYNGFIPINTQAIIELNRKVEQATLSDESIKTNVQDLDGSLDKVLEMRGVSYDWIHTVHPELNLDSANHVGFIAQEIEQIDSRLTYVADDSLLHVEYDKVVPILAEAIQELNTEVEARDSIIDAQQATIDAQQGTIEDLNARLTQLENCLSGILPFLCQLNQSAIQANTPEAQEAVRKNLTVTLSDRSTIVLDQNVPNPFAEQTVINFTIPTTVVKAQIHFYDGNGKLIQSVDVNDRGLGSLTVFGSDLSTGVYTYTLVADGQIVATKKMMKQ